MTTPGDPGCSALSATRTCAGRDRVEQKLGDLNRVERRALAEVVAREVEREPVLGGRVTANTPDEHVVDAGGGSRGRDLGQLEHADAWRRAQDLDRLLRLERVLELDPDRLGVADHDRHADTGR